MKSLLPKQFEYGQANNQHQSIRTIDVVKLSEIIYRAVPTIKSDLIRKPESLPPRILIPGSKKLVWLEADVLSWLEKHREVPKSQPRFLRRRI